MYASNFSYSGAWGSRITSSRSTWALELHLVGEGGGDRDREEKNVEVLKPWIKQDESRFAEGRGERKFRLPAGGSGRGCAAIP